MTISFLLNIKFNAVKVYLLKQHNKKIVNKEFD